MSKHVCKAPGCCRIAVDSPYCVEHQHLISRDRENNIYFAGKRHVWQELYNSSRWRELSRRKLSECPACQKCGINRATEVHHITPHRGNLDLFYDENNLVALCHNCHTEETKREVAQRRQKASRKLWY